MNVIFISKTSRHRHYNAVISGQSSDIYDICQRSCLMNVHTFMCTRFVVVCGDGEYIIYTAMALRNKSFGSAQEFVWAHDSSE